MAILVVMGLKNGRQEVLRALEALTGDLMGRNQSTGTHS